MNRPTSTLLVLLATLALALMLAGCSDSESSATSPDVTTPATADKDAATAVAEDLGAEGGGLADQIADFAFAMDEVDAAKNGFEADPNRPHGSIERVYDDATGTWTITIERERGNPEGVPYAFMQRVYTLRFLDAVGEPMQFRVVDGDTARAAEFAIVSGTGEHRTRRLEQHLTALSGAFVATGVNTDFVTINGTYHREAGNHLETPNFSRTLEGVLDLELVDVVAPRHWRLNHQDAVSGTINGTFSADITLERGDDYVEDHIDREFTIVFGGGEGELVMNGNVYRLRLGDGELDD
ncbi:MAG: hypothetical protein R3D98_03875 [Candidatus Krumholzibacteriia bacterium]